MSKIRVMVAMDFEVNGEYDDNLFDSLSEGLVDEIEDAIEMLDLEDGTRLSLDKVMVDSVEEM